MEGPYKVLVVTMWFINLKSAVTDTASPHPPISPSTHFLMHHLRCVSPVGIWLPNPMFARFGDQIPTVFSQESFRIAIISVVCCLHS